MGLFDMSNKKDKVVNGNDNMEHIWNLTDTNDFVVAMTEHLDNKTQYGEDMSALSEAERIFYITQTLEMEVNNGGFSQFFYNSSGNFSNELVGALPLLEQTQQRRFAKKQFQHLGVIFLLTEMRERKCWTSWKATNLMKFLKNVTMLSMIMRIT